MEKNIIERKKKMSNGNSSDVNKPIEVWTENEIQLSKSRYGCEIIKTRCEFRDSKDRSLPNDSFIVSYYSDDELCYDITRAGKRVNIFDMYWDKFGKNLKSIEWTYGRVNPKLWGYQAPKTKKRK